MNDLNENVRVGSTKTSIAKGAARRNAGKLPRSILRWTKVAASVGFAASMAAAAVRASHEAGGQSSAPSQPVMMLTPFRVDATAGLPDVAGPSVQLDALNKLCRAMETNDRTTIAECGDDESDATAGLARSLFMEEVSVSRIQNAWKTKFAVSMALPHINFDLFAAGGGFEMFLGRVLENPNSLQTQIDDAAHMRVSLPAELFAGTGIDPVATNHSPNFPGDINRRPENITGAVLIEQKICDEWARALNEIATKVEDGSISTKQAAARAIEDAAQRSL
jgi:hypothetical protein